MEYLRLGSTALKVSRLALGTMIFGSQLDERESFAILDRAVDAGINFIDLADVYPVPPSLDTAGRTEEIVGRWLRARPGSYVIATKFMGATGPGPNDRGGSRKHVIETCEASLRRLGVERVDLLYFHGFDPGSPLDETFEALDLLQRQGKINRVGISNFDAWQLALALQVVEKKGLPPVAVLQPRYSLLNRRAERDLLPLCRALGIGVAPYNPLGAGVLTGKYKRGQSIPGDSRFAWGEYGIDYQGRYWSDRAFDVADKVVELAKSSGRTPAQVAIGWLLAQPDVTSPIIGASSVDQLSQNIGALDNPLTDDEVKILDEASLAFS